MLVGARLGSAGGLGRVGEEKEVNGGGYWLHWAGLGWGYEHRGALFRGRIAAGAGGLQEQGMMTGWRVWQWYAGLYCTGTMACVVEAD